MLWEVALLFFFFIEIKELLCFLKVLMLDKACTGSFAYDDLHSVLIKNKIKPTRMMDVLFYLFFLSTIWQGGYTTRKIYGSLFAGVKMCLLF